MNVVAPPIAKMGEPTFWQGLGSVNLLISTNVKKAEQHVQQGFALLHAQWDVEAYRHFAAALKLDSDCLLAYCGVVMSVLNPEHEWKAYKNRALHRMLTLCEHQMKDEQTGEMVYTFPDNERGFALALAELITEGYETGAASFTALAKKYPNDMQLSLLAPFLNRGRYDVFGEATVAQSKALKQLKAVLRKHPNNPIAHNFYIMMLIEAPYNAVNQKRDVLPRTNKLLEISGGNVPCWNMLHGYAAWRAGELIEAKEAFMKAAAQYEKWKDQVKANLSECDGLMRAYAFLAIIHNELGAIEEVDKVMAKMAKAKYTRRSSSVHAFYEWNQQFMRTKMHLAALVSLEKYDKKLMTAAIQNLPSLAKNLENKDDFKLVVKGYQSYVLSLKSIYEKNDKKSLQMASLLGKIIYELKQKVPRAQKKPYYPHMLMALKALMVHHNEITAFREEKTGFGVVNWYNEAIDLQLGASRLFPPSILYPMEYRLGSYQERKGDMPKAFDLYEKAYQRMPSHQASKKAYERLKEMLKEQQRDEENGE